MSLQDNLNKNYKDSVECGRGAATLSLVDPPKRDGACSARSGSLNFKFGTTPFGSCVLPGRPFLCSAGGKPSGIPCHGRRCRASDARHSSPRHSSSSFPHQLSTMGAPPLPHRPPPGESQTHILPLHNDQNRWLNPRTVLRLTRHAPA
jgi:hypothetical protein